MLGRYSFVLLFLVLVATLAGVAQKSAVHPQAAAVEAIASTGVISSHTGELATALPDEPVSEMVLIQRRAELIEAMDRLVAFEHYYRSIYGSFTPLLSRMGFSVPPGVSDLYDLRIQEATENRLLVVAMGDGTQKLKDRVTLDQGYRLEANFPVPPPRAEYLQRKALKHLRKLAQSHVDQKVEEETVFREYFKYGKPTGENSKWVAVGVKGPVFGLRYELNQEQMDQSNLAEFDGDEFAIGSFTGENPETLVMAQKIYHGEVGRYAKNVSELSKIVSFRFENAQVPEIRGLTNVLESAKNSLSVEKIGTQEPELVLAKPAPQAQHNASKGLIVERIPASMPR